MKKINLPEYPVKKDMWDLLREEKRTIVIYGMGNGADMIIEVLDSLGLGYCDTFASDGFVRGHFYKQKRVLSYTEACEKYGNNFTWVFGA